MCFVRMSMLKYAKLVCVSLRVSLSLRLAVSGLRFAVCGLWFVVCGLWFAVCGLRFAVCGLRFSLPLVEHAA